MYSTFVFLFFNFVGFSFKYYIVSILYIFWLQSPQFVRFDQAIELTPHPQELAFQIISLWIFPLLRPHFSCGDHIPLSPFKVCIKKSPLRKKPAKSPLQATDSCHWGWSHEAQPSGVHMMNKFIIPHHSGLLCSSFWDLTNYILYTHF